MTSKNAPGTGKWWHSAIPGRNGPPAALDTTMAHAARVYDYWLGGKDNFAADRAAAQQAIAVCPDIIFSVRANRAFLARVVRSLAREAGIRQFLDIGTRINTANNTHEIAQSAAPDSRVVYVDNDPVVLAHARALLVGGPNGAISYLEADLRDPDRILAEAAQVLDFTRPVAVLLLAILQHIHDADDPYQIVARLMGAVPTGSYLAISHPARDIEADQMAQMAERLNRLMAEKVTFRDRAEVTRFFEGLELAHPRIVEAQQWRPDTEAEATSPAVLWVGVARKR